MKTKSAKPKRGWTDGYKTYDTSKGFGSAREWKKTFYERMTGEEATKIISDQADTPHQILGVPQNATQQEIKTAFRKLVMQWHPDKNPDRVAEAEEMTKKIIAAYTILTT
jgi:DnaJ-class molecular chaperone